MRKQLNFLKLCLLGLSFSTVFSCSDEPNATESINSSYDKEAYLKLGTKVEIKNLNSFK